MITLNLLSPRKRDRLSKLTSFLFIKELLELVLLTCTLMAMAYLLGWLVLTNFLNDLSESTTLVNRDYSSYNQEIVKINALVKKVNEAGKAFAPIFPQLLDIAKALPADIKLNSLTINRTNHTLVISGIAKTRLALLNYQSLLKATPWIGDFDIPTSDLFQKENIAFEILASFKNVTK